MPQTILTPPLSGILLGRGIKVITGLGDPNNATTDSSVGDLKHAAIGSLYLRADPTGVNDAIYVKTSSTVWTAK
jgi:hypothetical protein